MTYVRRAPHPALAPFVESIGIQESREAPVAGEYTRILPTATADILFHFGDHFEKLEDGNPNPEPRAYITGHRSRPLDVTATGETGIVIVSLHPWGIGAFTHASAQTFTDTTWPLDDFMPPGEIDEVIDRLVCATCPAGTTLATVRMDIVEEFMLKRLRDHGFDPLARHVANEINGLYGDAKIARIAQEHQVSKRQLDRRFVSSIGVTPKLFARVVRMQKALHLIRSGGPLANVSHELSFHDQSHMTKELKQLAGITPEKIFKDRCDTPLMASFNSPQMSRFYNTIYLN